MQVTAPAALNSGQANKLTIALKHAAVVNLVISDGKTHQIFHQAFPAGNSFVAVQPTADWGNRVQIRAQAVFSNNKENAAEQTLFVPMRHPEQDLTLQTNAPSRIITGQNFVLPINVQNIRSQQPTFLSAIVTPVVTGNAANLNSLKQEAVPVERDGKAALAMSLPEFSGEAKITLTAWNDTQIGSRTLTVQAAPALTFKFDPPPVMSAGDRVDLNFNMTNRAASDGTYRYTLNAPDGLKLSGRTTGTLDLRRGQSQTLPLALYANHSASGAINLEISGPDHFHMVRSWPVQVAQRAAPDMAAYDAQPFEPQQSMAFKPVEDEQARNFATLIGPAPLLTVQRDLPLFLAQTPFTTIELADWLDTTRLWNGIIATTALQHEAALKYWRSARLTQLLQRQMNDGSFPAWPDQKDGDLVSTAAAAAALQAEKVDAPAANLAVTRATQWLQRKLENTWFEETARAERAAGFLALMRMGKGDLSALRYYADTSKDKEMPAVAMAQMALAFNLAHDDQSAQFWQQQAQDALPRLIANAPVEAGAVLALLGEDAALDWKKVADLGKKLSGPTSLPSPAAVLRAVWHLNQRAGAWQFTMNGAQKKAQGIFVIAPSDNRNSITLRNTHTQTLFIARRNGEPTKQATAAPAPIPTIQQRLYQLDGGLLDDNNPLQRGSVYLLEFSGPYAALTSPLIMQSSSSAGLKPLLPRHMSAAALVQQLPWLGADLTAWQTAVFDGATVSFVINPPPNAKASDHWRVAYLVQAERVGNFNLPPVSLRAINGDVMLTETGRFQLQIK